MQQVKKLLTKPEILNCKSSNEMPLSGLSAIDLKPGQIAKIVGLNTINHKKLKKLMALGILPGMLIRVERRFPYYLFRVENAQIAADQELARDILVEL